MQTPPNHQGNVGGQVMPDEFGSEPLLGYRGWNVVNSGDGTGYALKSLHASHIWDRQVEAFCHQAVILFLRGRQASHLSPDPGCSCGIYAQLPEHPLREWENAKVGKVSASGTIAMWGRIIQCERGFKAQYAEIQAPIVLDMSCVKGCDWPPTMVGIPDHPQAVFPSYCIEHTRLAEQKVLVNAAIWLREVKESLSRRYGVEVLTWI